MKRPLPIIYLAERQRAQVERLVKFARDLDDTTIHVIEGPDGDLPYPARNNAAFMEAANFCKDRPWIWLEPDVAILKPHWHKALCHEYKRLGKPILLPDLSGNNPLDVASGIGAYPPETRYLVPGHEALGEMGFDLWIEKHLQPVIGRTPLIQHSFGRYRRGLADPHRFPRDNHILRPEAMLFHADKHGDINFPTKSQDAEPVVFKHGGDLGDVIASLPILRHLGGGKVVLFHDPTARPGVGPRESLKGARYEAIKPLLEVQDYITSVEWGGEISTSTFRETPRPKFESLLERQARHSGHWPVDTTPWLDVPEFKQHDRIICGRSPRYHNPVFPWDAVAKRYGDRLLFVGLPPEHAAFEQVVRRSVEHAVTPDFLEIAKLVAGAPQVVCNQSSLCWVSLGLGAKIICEGSPNFPNSQLDRPGSFWVYTGEDAQVLRRALAKLP